MTDKKTKSGLIILILIVIIALVLNLTNLFLNNSSSKSSSSRFEDSSNVVTKKIKNSSKNYVALLYVEGAIQEKGSTYNQEWILKTIDTLKDDDKNVGILLVIDSPGGTVYHSDETYLELLKYKATGKKVYSYFASIAASGGYYIGCAGDKIFANRNCLTGSIGVISSSSFDMTGLFEKIGIKSKTIHAGKNKNMLNINEPLSSEQENIMQSLADETYEQFTQIVAESRNMDIESVKKLADGRIYSANQAKQNGLIDDVCSLEDAEKIVKDELILNEVVNTEKLTFKEFKYQKPDNLRSILMEGLSFVRNPEASFASKYPLSYMYKMN